MPKAIPVTRKDAKPTPKGFKDYAGKTFGGLQVLGFSRRTKNEKGRPGVTFWVCQCHCGKVWEATSGNLKAGRTTQCPECGLKQAEANRVEAVTTHGMSGDSIYFRWSKLKSYFGVCKRWESFENFYEDMGDPPKGKPYLYREGKGPLSPENSRWSEYPNNSSQVDRDGSTTTLQEIGDRYGITRERVRQKKLIAEREGIDFWDYMDGKIKLVGRRGQETKIVKEKA